MRESTKVSIIGVGFVGAACAKFILHRGLCNHILLNDIVKGKALDNISEESA